MIGGFGDAEVFSLHATKFIHSFEGGVIATNDSAVAERLHHLRNFGFSDFDETADVGTNGKMSEVSAAMGITSLESMTEIIRINKRHYELYRRELGSVQGLRFVEYQGEQFNYQHVVIEVDSEVCGLQRDMLRDTLWAENVLARRYFYPGCHRMEPYRTIRPLPTGTLPVTERVSERVLSLPTGTRISASDVKGVSEIIGLAVREAPTLVKRLQRNEVGVAHDE